MQCEKCGLEMFSRPVFLDGERIPNFVCKNRQCERYVPDSEQAKEIITGDTQEEEVE